jgi:glycosyltransferase involved in cell wall biosynthesis
MAHDNPFNRAILDDSGFYFKARKEIAAWMNNIDHERKAKGDQYIHANLAKISTQFNWNEITKNHETLFNSLVTNETTS